MITVTATQRVRPGREATLGRLMRALTAQVRANEPGCSIFEWVRARNDPDAYLVIEQYADEATFAAHGQTAYLQAFLPELMRCLVEPPVVTIYDDA